MDTHVRTPQDIFLQPQHLLVPPFQRPYVWDKEEQWGPLWQDVRRLAERHITEPASTLTHFLGAVVLQAQEVPHGDLQASNVIDGQQRLTTLQLLMDATSSILDEAGLDKLSAQLEVMTHNQEMFVRGGGTRLKLRHSNRDRAAYDEVMDAEPPVAHTALSHSGSLVTRAHEFFSETVRAWLGESDSGGFERRAESLTAVLTRGLQLVAINLTAQENSQEIFETLNARGTPLTAADLIKNFVFQRLDAEGADTMAVYSQDWPFESKFWEAEISVGRNNITRSSLFFNQWLAARTGEEVSPKATFTRFKHFVEAESQDPLTQLLPQIKQQAAQYQAWTEAADDPDRQLNRVELCVYRMKSSGVELLKPLLIWLHSPTWTVPQPVIDQVVAAAESWVVRRQLLRLSGSDLGRIVAEIIKTYSSSEPSDLGVRVSDHLARLDVSSTYWPGDDEVRAAMTEEPVYRRFRRGRVRMLLEAVEDVRRQGTNQPQVPRRGYPIEHVMPQKWPDHWPVEGVEAEVARSARIHRLGNLTLLTQSLNSKVSNGPWETKRAGLNKHDTLLLNSRLLADPAFETWDEAAVDLRTTQLIDELLGVWPVPKGHVGEIADPQSRMPSWVETKHLVSAGLLEPGTRLTPRTGVWGDREATLLANGNIKVDDQVFDTPSAAAKFAKGGQTNGWTFWRLPDGRSLSAVRAVYKGESPSADSFDWSLLHTILEALPEGAWTSYGALADAVGTAAQAVGNHIMGCRQCANAHRVLTADGRVAPHFAWDDAAEERKPAELLMGEGVVVVDGRAEPQQALDPDALARLTANDG